MQRFIALIALIIAGIALGAETKTPGPLFIGLRPGVTVEPFYPAGVFDLNVCPISLELKADGFPVGVRATSIINVTFGLPSPQLAQTGGMLSFPIYLFDQPGQTGRGLFAGPKTALTWQETTRTWCTGASLEAGWSIPADSWSIMICAEYGWTVFLPEGRDPVHSGHGGLSCVVGVWL